MTHSGFGEPCSVIAIVLENRKLCEAWSASQVRDFFFPLHFCLIYCFGATTIFSSLLVIAFLLVFLGLLIMIPTPLARVEGSWLTWSLSCHWRWTCDSGQANQSPSLGFSMPSARKMLSFCYGISILGSKPRTAYGQVLNLYRPWRIGRN